MEIQIQQSPKIKKTIVFDTNFNNKLACHCFVHIDLAPSSGIPESVLNNTVIEIATADHSHPPVMVELIDLKRCMLGEVCTAHTWPSHGLEAHEFEEWFILKKPHTSFTTAMAIYFYRKTLYNDTTKTGI